MKSVGLLATCLVLVACAASRGPSLQVPLASPEPVPPAPAPAPSREPTCALLRDVPAAHEISRAVNGDVTILKFALDFPEHREVVTKVLGAGAGVTVATPAIVFPATVFGPHSLRSIMVRGTSSDALAPLQKYLVSGSFAALDRAAALPPVILGAELASAIGAGLGDEVTLAPDPAEASSATGGAPGPTASPTLHKARVVGVLRLPAGALTAYDSSIVFTTLAHAATLSDAPPGGATGVVAWVDADHAQAAAVVAIVKALDNAMYRVIPGIELHAGLRRHLATLEAYCGQ